MATAKEIANSLLRPIEEKEKPEKEMVGPEEAPKKEITTRSGKIASALLGSEAYTENSINGYNDTSKSFYDSVNALYRDFNNGVYKTTEEVSKYLDSHKALVNDTERAMEYFKDKDEKTYKGLESELTNLYKLKDNLNSISSYYGRFKDENDYRISRLYNVAEGSEGAVADSIRDIAFTENRPGVGEVLINPLTLLKDSSVITEDGMMAMSTLLAKEGYDVKKLLSGVRSSKDNFILNVADKVGIMPDDYKDSNAIVRNILEKYGFTDGEITSYLSAVAYDNGQAETDRQFTAIYQKINDTVHSKGWTDAILSVVSVPMSVLGGVSAAVDLIHQNIASAIDDTFVMDYHNENQMLNNASANIRGKTEKDISKKFGEGAGVGYQIGMSIADSVLAMVASAGIGAAISGASAASGTMSFAQAAQKAPWVSGVLLGSSAGATTTQSFKAMGYTDSEAFAMGVLAGTAESVFETWSLEKLLGDTINKLTKASLTEVGAKRLLKQTGAILGQALCEGSEELATEVANAMSEVFVLGAGNTTMDAAMSEYMAQGMSYHDAHTKALLDKSVDILLAFVGGAISGGVMGGGAFTMNSAQQMALKLQYHRDYLKGVTALEKVLDNNVAMSKLRTKLATSFQTTGDKLIDSHINAIVKAGNDENVLRTEYAKVGAEPEVREAALLISVAAQNDTKNNESLAAEISSVLGVTVTAEDLATNRGGIATIYASYLYFDGLTVSGKKAVIDRAIARTEKFLDEQIKKNKDSVQGRIYYGEVDKSKFDALRKHSVRAIENLANVLDVNVVFFDSSVKGNMKVNGFLDRSTNTVYLDINSGNNAEGVMLFTMAHELVHFMKQESANSYKVLEQFLIDTYGKDKMNTLINEQITKAKKYGDNMSPEAALEEVICDFAARMLADKKVLTDFARLSNKHKGLAEKIKSFFADSETKLEDMYGKFEADTPESYELTNLSKSSLEAFRGVFEKALLDTAVTYRGKKKDGTIGTIDLNAYKEAKDSNGDLVFAKKSTNGNDLEEHKKIVIGMTDDERYNILKNKEIGVPFYLGEVDSLIESEIESKKHDSAKKAILAIAEKIGIVDDEINFNDIDLDITLSRKNIKESVSKKANIKQIAKLLPILSDVAQGSVHVEQHTNRYYHDTDTIFFDNLVGAYADGKEIVPIRFGLKHSRTGNTVLYVVIDQNVIDKSLLTEIKKDTGHQDSSLGSSPRNRDLRRRITYSISQIIEFVNSKDLLKYMPDPMLTEKQIVFKREGISESIEYTNNKNDEKYIDAIKRGDNATIRVIVNNAAKTNGYTYKGYHGTQKSRFNVFVRGIAGIYLATNRELANDFATGFRGEKGTVYELYAKLENPLIVDDHTKSGVPFYYNIPTPTIMKEAGYTESTVSTEEIAHFAEEHNHDGVVIKGIREGADVFTDDIIVFDPTQVKSADPIVYDDDGNIIPISKRFNSNNDDIRFSRKYTPEEARAAIERVKSGEGTEAPKVKNFTMTTGALKKFISEFSKNKRYSKEVAKEITKAFEGVTMLKPEDIRNITELIWEGLNDFSDSGYKKIFAKDMAKFYVSKLIEEQSIINVVPDKITVEMVNAVKSGIHKLTFTEENRAELRHLLGDDGFKRFVGRWGNKSKENTTYLVSQFVVDFAREHSDLVGSENLEGMSVEDALVRIDEIYSAALRDSKNKTTVADYLDSEEYENYIANILDNVETSILNAYETKGKDTYYGYIETQLHKEREKMTAINRITRLLDRFEHQSRANKADLVYTDIVNGLKLFKAYQGKNINVDNVKAYAEKLEAFIEKFNSGETFTVSVDGKEEVVTSDAFDIDKAMIDDEAKEIIKALKNIDASNIGEGERDLTLEEYKMLNDTLGLVARITASFGNEYIDGEWRSNLESVVSVINSSSEAYNKNKHIENVLKSPKRRTLKEQFDTPTDYINFIFGSREENIVNRYVNDIVKAADDMRAEYIKLIRPYEKYLADDKYFNRLYKEEVTICGEKITIGEFISLYCTSKREQAHSGLVGKKTVFGNANEKSTSKLPGRRLRKVMLGNSIKEVKANIEKAYESLNDKDKAFIKLVEEFFNEISTYIKTAADLKYFGYTNAQDESYYFPITREGSGRDIASVYVGAISVVKQSFNHSINKKANGALSISNVFDVLTKHLDGLMQYKHMFVPVQNFSKLFGKNVAEKGQNANTILMMLQHNTGGSTVQYIRDWLANLQGKNTAKRDITTFKSFLATSSLGFNLQSVAKQNASLVAMMSEGTPEVVLSLLEEPIFNVLNKEEMTRYSSVASYRIHDNAPYSAAIGKVSSDMIPKTGLEEFGASFRDKATSFLRWGDQRVTYAMWSACQRIVARKQGLKLNTVENLVAAGKLLDEMINKYNDTTSNALRPLAIREGGWYSVWSMFASQPIKLWSSMMRYAEDIRTAKALGNNEAKKKAIADFLKAESAILLQAVWTTLVTMIFRALMRKGLPKDEDEITAHVIGVTYVTEVLGVMPIIGDIVNVVLKKIAGEYTYDIGGDAMSEYYNNVASLLYTGAQAFQGKGDLAEGNYKKVFELIASVCGVPAKNIYKYSTILTSNVDQVFKKTSTYVVDYYYSGYAPTVKELKNAAKKDSRYAETMLEILASKKLGSKDADSELSSYTIEELLRLYKAEIKKGDDGDLGFLLPPSVPKEFSKSEAKTYYATMEKAYTFANNLLDSARYKALDDSQRRDAISSVWSIYNDAAKVSATKSAASVPQAARYMIVTSGEKSAEIYVLANAYEKAYNNASKQEKAKMKPVATYLSQLCREYGISNEQRVIIAAALGVGATKDIKNAVKKKAESKGITIITSDNE